MATVVQAVVPVFSTLSSPLPGTMLWTDPYHMMAVVGPYFFTALCFHVLKFQNVLESRPKWRPSQAFAEVLS